MLPLKLKIIPSNKYKQYFLVFIALLSLLLLGVYIVNSNENSYKKTIAKVLSISENNFKSETSDGRYEAMKKQHITAVILNGKYSGKEIKLENIVSYSQINDINLHVNDKVFISLSQNVKGNAKSIKILELKRDKYVFYVAFIFILLIIAISGKTGLRSLVSVVINIVIFSIIIELFLNNFSLPFIFLTAMLLFTVLSLIMVSGLNKKTISAVVSTLLGTTITILIAIAAIKLNNSNGVRFEEMEFLTHPPEKMFYIELLIGTLGAIMDIAISISAAINELYLKNPSIETKSLIESGLEIGKDIMGTMSNTMLFAYFSGSIPFIILLLRNQTPLYNIINENLSLEILRALTGSIGIVISIPISIFVAVVLLNNKRIGEFIKS
ncbi:membrane protein [Clostridium acetobutylicum]|nr:membrane protein [Clostridium acetobutylicum]